MLIPQSKVVRIPRREAGLSSQQKAFNRQIKQIERLRRQLAAWESASSAYRDKYSRELAPRLTRRIDLMAELVQRLDRAMAKEALTPAQERKLTARLVELAAAVLSERDDATIKSIYNEHNPVDYDSEAAAHAEEVKSFLEDMFDLDLGEAEEHDSIDGLFERARAQFREKHAQSDAEARTRRRETKTAQRRSREEDDAKRVSQSIREVYRKLVSELHPDRETDPEERARKTALMQRINQAYAKRNLLELLELQLELEHISEHYVAGLDPERLRHFNLVLKEQIAELKHELGMIEARFREQFDLPSRARLQPHTVLRELDVAIIEVMAETAALEADLALVAEPKGVKAWLKKLRRRTRAANDDALGD